MNTHKQFTYLDQEHIVHVQNTPKGTMIEFDGVPCASVQYFTQSGVLHLESTVEIDGDRLTIYVYGKEIFVFKGDIDIETNVRKHPKGHLHWFWIVLSKFSAIPFLALVYLVYNDSVFNIHRVSESTWMTAKLCLVICGTLAIFKMTNMRCLYYQRHPLAPIGQKRKGIVLWTFLSLALSTLLLLISNYWILR